MYKSKLQELCHRKAWDLPMYTAAKHGADHSPRFQATVTVNDVSFTTENLCKSSKEAQNEAARIAFEHFTSSLAKPSSSPSSVHSSCDSSSEVRIQVGERETDETCQLDSCNSACSDDVNRSGDTANMYKNQLQNYVQKMNLALPMYSCERKGPPHDSRFRCKVNVGGRVYENPEFFSTLKEAEHAVAKTALTYLLPAGAWEDDVPIYKNLLQEWTQKQGLNLPVYSTVKSGEAHLPAFLSTVEVGGKVFTGQEARAKKQAEMYAAKAAYMTLNESSGNKGRSPKVLSSATGVHTQHSSLSKESNLIADLDQVTGSVDQMSTNTSFIPRKSAEQKKGNKGRSTKVPSSAYVLHAQQSSLSQESNGVTDLDQVTRSLEQMATNTSFIPGKPVEEKKVNGEPVRRSRFDDFPQPAFTFLSGYSSLSDAPVLNLPERTPSSSSLPPPEKKPSSFSSSSHAPARNLPKGTQFSSSLPPPEKRPSSSDAPSHNLPKRTPILSSLPPAEKRPSSSLSHTPACNLPEKTPSSTDTPATNLPERAPSLLSLPPGETLYSPYAPAPAPELPEKTQSLSSHIERVQILSRELDVTLPEDCVVLFDDANWIAVKLPKPVSNT